MWVYLNITPTPTNTHTTTTQPHQTFLRWLDPPRNVLLLMKRGSGEILQRVADITNFLQAREGVRVLVERQVGWCCLKGGGMVYIYVCVCMSFEC
jgi:hypothetical protein